MNLVDEIKAILLEAGTIFNEVAGAVGLAAAQSNGPLATPAAYVFLGKEASSENQRATGPVSQRQERDLSIVIVVENVSDPRGDAGADELEAVKIWLRGKLIGFTPAETPSSEPVTHVEGAIADFKNGQVWYEDVYSAPTYLKEI